MLRASGGTTACLQMPPLVGEPDNAGQIGLDAPGFLSLPLSPVVFRKARVAMEDGELPNYELLISGDAVAAQVSQMQLGSAQTLFSMARRRGGRKLFLSKRFPPRRVRAQPICIACCYRKPAENSRFNHICGSGMVRPRYRGRHLP